MPYQIGDEVIVISDNKIYAGTIQRLNRSTVTVSCSGMGGGYTTRLPWCRIKRPTDETVCIGLLGSFSQQWSDDPALAKLRAPAKDWMRSSMWSGDGLKHIPVVFAARNKDRITATTVYAELGYNGQITFDINKNWK